QTQGDLDTARKALNEALTICTDDESLSSSARALPPGKPVRFVASLNEDARIAKLSWEPGFGSTDDVLYQVIRKVGTPPLNGTDGTLVATGIRGTSCEDVKPPVAVTVYYGVSASRGGGMSPVAVAEVVALPPVSDVGVASNPSSITLRWTPPPEASRIEIIQTAPDGSTSLLQPSTQSGATSSDLRMGATYTYLLTAIYIGAMGELLRSATVRTIGVPRGSPRPVPAITITTQTATGVHPEIAVEWVPIHGFAVEVWHYKRKPAWPAGTRLPMSEIRAQGRQLAGQSIEDLGRQGVTGVTEQGVRYYVAITRDGEFGLVGAVRPHGTTPPIQNLCATRFGGDAVLSWDWPSPECQVRVRWDGTSSGERIIAMSEYQENGGCRISLGSGGGAVEVASVAGEGHERWCSSSTNITVEGTTIVVEYDISFQKKVFGPPNFATLQFAMPASATPIDVVVVAHFNRWMPADASQGSVLAQTTVSAASPRVKVELPRDLKGPVWVRAFTTSPGTRLIDPPPTLMMVTR
ncbi:fibronectin type III domain-containing protein, partial [Ferrimicrobium sp.]|uniref:fibronectin type III domain-containing protein n=1 Tax=Ferrimicrobium sp. TaxID=2926050 RepID=UPI00260B4BA8